MFAVTIFLSAFLLFQVQPMIAKIILPWFGGSAAVWSAALLFFQAVLLAGYGYAHWSVALLKPHAQRLLHVALLALSILALPILPSPSWKPTDAGDPTLRILALLAATLGLPYLLLSSTTPLLQAWYVRRTRRALPYRLFALSNFGSMAALVSYPALVEPRLATRAQAWTWSAGYALFAALCAVTAWISRRGEPAPVSVEQAEGPVARPAPAAMALWVALAACASTLLVATTNHLSQNVAPIPLLWVGPLAIYLGTFILCFESDRLYRRAAFLPLAALALGGMAYLLYLKSGNLDIKWLIPAFLAGLFVCAMVCHGELARRKPHPRYLTEFYLMVSLGGALGGLFVAFLAPRLFRTYLELPVGLVGCALLAAVVTWERKRVFASMALLAAVVAGYLGWQEITEARKYRLTARNFYGVLKVRDDPESEDENAARVLLHGTINHGTQLLDEDMRYETTAYYGETSGVGRALQTLEKAGPLKVGVVGLGAGVLANYGRRGDTYRFYEINPLVQKIATTEFSFLAHCPADKRVLLGDARLVLEREPPQQFDLLAVDAFSSDAIPVHLLTREALKLYFRHLKAEGVLALHISNRYLGLEPVTARGAADLDMQAMVVSDDPEADYLSSSTWVLLTRRPDFFRQPNFEKASLEPAVAKPGFRTWTDDYSNIIQILK